VDPRQRWQALQSHLHAARSRFESGDRAAALREIDAALALDREFLAALTLRERILTAADRPAGKPASIIEKTAAAPAPAVSAEGWARFEQRARQRRMERRLAAARSAIFRGRLDEARAAMSEVRGLDPHHPELIALGMELEAAEHSRPWRFRFGPSLAAAAAFSAIVLGASWLENTTGLLSYPMSQIAGLVPGISPTTLTNLIDDAVPAVGTTGAPDGSTDVARDLFPLRTAAPPAVTVSAEVVQPTPSAGVPPRETSAPEEARPAANGAIGATGATGATGNDAPIAPASVSAALMPVPTAPPPTPSEPSAAVSAVSLATLNAVSSPLAAAIPVVDEEGLVRRTLQRYRAAYEGLDAQSAHEVWPAVNQSALARAFDGLQSQRLNFETCDVELAGPAAKAVCRGSARYVPKIGSREPRVEPRVWNFTLRKAGDDWQIENARAER
jgi:hypothetical protein